MGARPARLVKVFAPYSGANQYVDIQSADVSDRDVEDWSGGRLHVRVKIGSGSTFLGQIEALRRHDVDLRVRRQLESTF